ncbi:MAG: STAS domain-containing protein [Methanoregula sp.]|jgi:anti-anti-sigma factor|nr:STAS domain-containing protein [Methanoregula sp.]
MEITASRTGDQLVLTLTGRMDGTGAQQVTAAIRQNLTDHDMALIFDLGGVDYLSSAGLRVFQESARQMKERKGRIAVCQLQDFVRRIFTAGGFLRVVNDFPTVEAALVGTASAASTPAGDVKISGTGWTLSAHHQSDTPGILAVTGNLAAVHAGTVTAADIREMHLSPGGFGIATGAMARNMDEAAPLLGEMVQAGGRVYWIPTDGNLNPDFFTAKDLESSGMKTFTLFSTSFSGPFADVLRITSDKPEGMTLTEVYAAIFQYMKAQYPDFKGVCAVALKATIGGLCSSDMKNSLIAAAADRAAKGTMPMPGGRTVTELPFDGSVAEKISAVNVTPQYGGSILICIGFGIDPATAGRSFPEETVAALYFKNPRSATTGPFLFNKGLVFRNFPWDNTKSFDEQIRVSPADGEFVAVHNLLNITTVKSAVAGVLPVSVIRNGDTAR